MPCSKIARSGAQLDQVVSRRDQKISTLQQSWPGLFDSYIEGSDVSKTFNGLEPRIEIGFVRQCAKLPAASLITPSHGV